MYVFSFSNIEKPKQEDHIPVYVIRYAMTTHPDWLKPFKSLAIVTSAVLTMETSRFGRKIAIEILFNVNSPDAMALNQSYTRTHPRSSIASLHPVKKLFLSTGISSL